MNSAQLISIALIIIGDSRLAITQILDFFVVLPFWRFQPVCL